MNTYTGQNAGHVVIVGSGLAGLTAAAWLAKDGWRVTVLERASTVGGRARTHHEAGWSLNLGPHALYRAGAAAAGLAELGVQPKGGVVPTTGWLRQAGRLSPLPGTPLGLLTTALLPGTSRFAAMGWFASLPFSSGSLDGKTVTEWLAPLPDPARALAHYFIRLSTYVHAPDEFDAGVASRQLARALRGVWYLDGGWESLVKALADVATTAGATIRTGSDVVRTAADSVTLSSGESIAADVVILAVPPLTCRKLGATVPDLTPVRAACLDLGLGRLPVDERRSVWDLDQPLYLSNHAAVGALAPKGAAMVHVLRYLAPNEPTAGAIAGLEAFADDVQPGWREEVRVRKEAPALVVAHTFDRAGIRRPGIRSPEGHWLCGDWVEAGGALLADASVASARSVVAALRVEAKVAA